MADHRANDLSYGHLGEATYDADEKAWGFSADISHSYKFQQILPFAQDQPPSIKNASEATESSGGNAAREQSRWLLKFRPETFPAKVISSTYSRSNQGESSIPVGQLLAVGGAVDVSRTPAYRTVPLIAMPCGEAGNVLRLIRPRMEYYGWGIQSCVRLPLMDASVAEQGHWAGMGGRIQQITFAEDGNFSSTWLAVRQLSMITFFRPMFDTHHIPTIKPEIFEVSFPLSHISANPVAVLNAQQSDSKVFADVSFNPFYRRQFAVVDDAGCWSTWDIEGRKNLNLIVGKQGNIIDRNLSETILNKPDITDGWHQIAWVTNVSTIAVCDRRSLVVFDITAKPKQLRSRKLLASNSTDWILDMKRSAVHSNHLYLLTSSRIFWLQVVADSDGKNPNHSGVKLILSYRHYRNPNDVTMKLVVLKDNDVSVIIMSRKTLLINYYKFSMDDAGPASSHGSLVTSHHMTSNELQSLLFLQAALIPRLSRAHGPEFDYIERGVRFYQAWSLASNLEMSSTIYAVYGLNVSKNTSPMSSITAPTRKFPDALRRETVKRIKSHFIVADGDLNEDKNVSDQIHPADEHMSRKPPGDPLKLRINWTDIYRQVFCAKAKSSETQYFIKTLKTAVLEHLYLGKERKQIKMSTMLELCQLPMFYKDLEQANLNDFWDDILNEDDIHTPFALVLSNVAPYPGKKASLKDDFKPPTFVQVYDRLVGHWIQSLPREISNQSRLSIFNITRRVAVEICLSSIAVSYRVRSADLEQYVTEAEEAVPPTSDTRQRPNGESQFLSSSQITTESIHDARFGLPTPAQTPSLHSGGSESLAEPGEDPAVLRLRQYAISIDSPQEANKLMLLSHWASSPGVDPANFSWKPTQQSSTADDEADYKRDQKRRREEARRKRKTEKFLIEDARRVFEPPSQPAAMTSYGSQPGIARHAASSQLIDELPMTQPSRGQFGSRSTDFAKKKQRRRNAGF